LKPVCQDKGKTKLRNSIIRELDYVPLKKSSIIERSIVFEWHNVSVVSIRFDYRTFDWLRRDSIGGHGDKPIELCYIFLNCSYRGWKRNNCASALIHYSFGFFSDLFIIHLTFFGYFLFIIASRCYSDFAGQIRVQCLSAQDRRQICNENMKMKYEKCNVTKKKGKNVLNTRWL